MLSTRVLPDRPADEELKIRLDAAKEKLAALQMQLKEKMLPVVVLVEGWDSSGKGSIIGQLVNAIDPRFFKVATMEKLYDEDLRKPFLWRFFKEIPEYGKITFFDSGWMAQTAKEKFDKELNKEQYEARIRCIRNFERQLVDNGYLVIKLFVDISEKTQKKRMMELKSSKNTTWRVTSDDFKQNKHYDEYYKIFDKYLDDTDTPDAPWYVIDASARKWARLQAFEILNEKLEMGLQNGPVAAHIPQNQFKMAETPLLKDVSLVDKELTEEVYRAKLKALQNELSELHNKLYRKRIPVVIAYEGWDAAGKGGNIKRITKALDPRGYEVVPVASPLPHEKARHFLWRFYVKLPKSGHITIFDRTWYGRVMVERLEGYCTENDWKRAYNEINEFEKDLTDWGAVVIKFWVQVDKDTQLERFTERQNTPEKQWKITDEDWRNREKWDLYEGAIDEMIQKTSTEHAPWYILESRDKKYARIKALEIVVEQLKKACE